MNAAERHTQLVRAALTAFATGGYAGTTTDQVARIAGVSQPYVIRLFGTKQQLFIATLEHAGHRIEEVFRAAAAVRADRESLSEAYCELLAERELLTVMLHGFAAGTDPDIGPVIRGCLGRIYRTVVELTGIDQDEARDFLAAGMLWTVLAAVQVLGPGAVPPEPWTTALIGDMDAKVARAGRDR